MSENAEQERDDVRHDPAHAAGEPDDWASEGGAVSEGPATHPDDGREQESAVHDGTED